MPRSALSPLLDKDQKKWLNARRCDLCCHRGEYDKALAHATQVKGKFYEELVTRLGNRIAPQGSPRPATLAGRASDGLDDPSLARPANRGEVRGPRVELPIGFVQQHHKTCAPATLTSIAKFWSMPAEHVEVAEEIAYYGTPAHAERKWAEDHGWHAKSFTCTWDATVALIDAGIPFTLATTEVSSAHLQAIVGYDSVRRTLIVRDPGERHKIELSFALMLDRYRSTGPRGMALVPLAQKEKLDAISLPDEAMYEHLHRFDLALVGHCRAEAEKQTRAMAVLRPGHFLTLHARRFLAYYDADLPQELLCVEQLLTLFPSDLRLQLDRAYCLSVLGRREERLELLRRLSEQKETDPACWQLYAQELSADARRNPETLYLLKKAVRATPPGAPLQGRLLDTLARIRWNHHDFDEAMKLHHFATCVDDKDEYLAQNYFMSALARGQTDMVLSFLQHRFKRFGAKSSLPARTLYWAYMQMERRAEAFETLDEAIRLRPEDGELLTYVGEAHMYRGEFEQAEATLARADGVSKPAARLRSLAYLAFNQDQRVKARDLWAEVIKIEPLAEDAHQIYALLLGEKEERAEAVKHLTDACARFPHHFGLTRMLYAWHAEDGPAAREPILKRLIDIHPADIWVRIEYAYNLADQDRFEEGFQQLEEGERLDPSNPGVWFARGILFGRNKRIEDAQYACREAIRRNVDFEAPIHELLRLCENLQDRRETVAFVVAELLRQTTFGNGLVALHAAAQPNFPPDELFASLRRVRDARPELWQAWSSVTRQLGYANRDEESLSQAQMAVQRFPANFALWLDLAERQRHVDTEAELQSLRRAVELAPGNDLAVRRLAEALERANQTDQAKKMYEQAIRRAPLVPYAHVDYADLLARLHDYDGAIKQARHALKIDPWFEEAWNRLRNWYVLFARFDDLIELARAGTKKLPGDMRTWNRLAQAYQAKAPQANNDEEKKRIDDCTRAYDEALKRNPYACHIHDFKAEMLAKAQRFDEARQACNPPAWKGKPPLELRVRSIWVEAQEQDFDAAKKQMVALLREDPSYDLGWNMLVDWSFASQDYHDYLAAAGNMLRAQPQSAIAFTYRGEARLRMEERDAGIEDLKNAYRKDPCNIFTSHLLFDELLTDNNLAGAEAILLAMKQNLFYHHVEARAVQLALKKENKEAASAEFTRMCESPFTLPSSLDFAVRAFDQANWKDAADRAIHNAMQKPNWNLHLAMLYASGWNPNLANDLPDRIAALDRALERQPEAFVFLDLKANMLTNGNQFELAWQVCQSKTFPQDEVALQGRAAWVMYRSGNGHDAIAKMKELVRDHPKYMWGWYQLAEWYGQQQAWVDCLTVAETLVHLAPRDPAGFFHRGWAKQNLGDLQAARADFAHALDLAPSYVFAAWQLFDLHIRNSEWRKAERILEKVQKHADKGDWALRKVEMLVYQNRKATFPAEFENLLRNSAKNPWLIDQSLQFLIEAGWWADAEEVLHKCLDLGTHICDPWVRLRVNMGDRSVGRDIQNMSERRPERTNCVAAYAIELADAKNPHRLQDLHNWINEEEDGLRADTPSWAKVGIALYVAQDWTGLCEWMSDWPDHDKATPGQLLPLVKALRAIDRIESARKVSGYALTKLNPDFANAYHKVWLIYDQAMNGEVLPVQRYLETSDLGGFDGYHQMIAAMVRALWLAHTDKDNGFALARQVLVDAATWAQPTVHDPALAKSYHACVAEVAALCGTLSAKLWRMWRWLFPKLPQMPKPTGQ